MLEQKLIEGALDPLNFYNVVKGLIRKVLLNYIWIALLGLFLSDFYYSLL